MPERTYAANTSYRYGFNGKENDNEVSGEGNKLDFGARIYDSRLGRWLSVDPLQSKYPNLSPYQYCANSPISSIDPDGRLIIFINGLWGWPNQVGQGGTVDYWGAPWVERVQKAIGDHKTPLYIDGSLGGTSGVFRSQYSTNTVMENRIRFGKEIGYKSAYALIATLDKGETIKIITNSMGAAFERGFTEGILKYQTEENGRRARHNVGVDKKLAPLLQQKQFLEAFQKEANGFMSEATEKKLNNELNEVNSKIGQLEAQRKEILNVQIEMVIDLSPHQVDYPDPNAQSSYYMTAEGNVTKTERLGGVGVKEKHIKGAKYLGKMSAHHSSGAEPEALPPAKNKNNN